MSQGQISEKSRRVAQNTIFLWFRMLLLLLIGLYTSRVVLRQLGVEDYGVYSAVGSIIALANVITGSVGSAIGRYLSQALGIGDMDRMKKAFSSSICVQLIMGAAFLLILETAGLWYLNFHMDIPDGRLGAANWVLQCSAGILLLQLLSIPYNQTIIAHERMDAYAYISILEACLKLGIALLLTVSRCDMLKFYAVLMLLSALIVRCTYAWFCKRHFEETRGKVVFDRQLTREMARMAQWNVLWSGAYSINEHGANLLMNAFFGIVVNAARGVAVTVEGTVRSFMSNVLTAINPQITKSYATGDTHYCFNLVNKGIKYSWLIVLFVAVPLCFEAPFVLRVWLGHYPDDAALFAVLVLFSLAMNFGLDPLAVLMRAQGEVGWFYGLTSATSILILPATWVAYGLGLPPQTYYIASITMYVIVNLIRLLVVHSKTGFPIDVFLKEVALKIVIVSIIAAGVTFCVRGIFSAQSWSRLIAVVLASTMSLGISAYFIAFTPGERSYIVSLLRRFLPGKHSREV